MAFRSKTLLAGIGVLAAGLMAVPAQAAALIGEFDISGSVRFNVNSFDFVRIGAPNPASPNVDGRAIITGVSGSFVGTDNPILIKDLCDSTTLGCAGQPFAVSTIAPSIFPLENFLDLGDVGSFTLTFVAPALFTPTSTGTGVTFNVEGIFVSPDGDESTGTGVFTTQIEDDVYAGFPSLLAFLQANPETFVLTSYSASFTAVPEPAPLAPLAVFGALGAAVLYRRRAAVQR